MKNCEIAFPQKGSPSLSCSGKRLFKLSREGWR